MNLDSIYLNKRNNNAETSEWAYYRLTSLGGSEGDHIQVCLLEWPSLSDIDVVGDEKKAVVINPWRHGIRFSVSEPLRPSTAMLESQTLLAPGDRDWRPEG